MGVSDNDFYKASALISNTSLYKQAGNSIAVSVLEKIFKQLFNKEIEHMSNKELLIKIFKENIKGKAPDVSSKNKKHDGKYGHWLEQQFGIQANGDNEADILGYELKNETSSGKTTFGDWSANEYIFKSGSYTHLFEGKNSSEKQDSFCRLFGKPNEKKDGRYSWSGSPIPKINKYNDFGQIMTITEEKDIIIYYSYSRDKRIDKDTIIPSELRFDNIILAKWYGERKPLTAKAKDKTLKSKLENKFNNLGWFTCKKDSSGKYQKICFGAPVNFENWIKLVEIGIVYFDSGMYQGNKRPYSQWRADNSYWDSLIEDCYE